MISEELKRAVRAKDLPKVIQLRNQLPKDSFEVDVFIADRIDYGINGIYKQHNEEYLLKVYKETQCRSIKEEIKSRYMGHQVFQKAINLLREQPEGYWEQLKVVCADIIRLRARYDHNIVAVHMISHAKSRVRHAFSKFYSDINKIYELGHVEDGRAYTILSHCEFPRLTEVLSATNIEQLNTLTGEERHKLVGRVEMSLKHYSHEYISNLPILVEVLSVKYIIQR